MKRTPLPLCAALALAFAVPSAADAATAADLKLDWKMTAAAAPTAATASKAQAAGLFAWPPQAVWSVWMQLSTTSPWTVMYFR